MVGLEVHVQPEPGGGLVVAFGTRPLPEVGLGQVHLQVGLVGRGKSAVVARAPVMLLLPVAAAVEVFGLGVLNERLSSE